MNGSTISYPKNWNETKKILYFLDERAEKIENLSRKSKEWKELSFEINSLKKEARKKINECQLNLKTLDQKIDRNLLLSLSSEIHFQKKNFNAFQYWIKNKRVPEE